jgi:hypothetical protein
MNHSPGDLNNIIHIQFVTNKTYFSKTEGVNNICNGQSTVYVNPKEFHPEVGLNMFRACLKVVNAYLWTFAEANIYITVNFI